MIRSPRPATVRAVAVRTTIVVAVGAALLLGAAPASAHVTARPGVAEQGGYIVVTFRVPDESDTAGTVELAVRLPTDHPIVSVRTTPVPGWTAAVVRAALDPPVQVNGDAVAAGPPAARSTADDTARWLAGAGLLVGALGLGLGAGAVLRGHRSGTS